MRTGHLKHAGEGVVEFGDGEEECGGDDEDVDGHLSRQQLFDALGEDAVGDELAQVVDPDFSPEDRRQREDDREEDIGLRKDARTRVRISSAVSTQEALNGILN